MKSQESEQLRSAFTIQRVFIVHKEFVSQGQTVNPDLNLVLNRLCTRISRVRPEYRTGKQLLLLHENATSHKDFKVCDFLNKK